jgi:hypothetical protein
MKNHKTQKSNNNKIPSKFIYSAVFIFLLKLVIIFNIDGKQAGSEQSMHYIKGIWLGADGENYITSYKFLVNEGIYSQAFILNFWPAGYPLFMLLVSLFGKSWIFVNISIIQSFIFSISAFYFAKQIYRTRVKGYAFFILLLILLNPTLSLSSVAVGYESVCSSGILISTALIIKDFIEKKDDNFFMFLSFSSLIYGFLSFMQPRLLVTGFLVNSIWLVARKGIRVKAALIVASFVLTLFFPSTLVYRNYVATKSLSISANLGETMAVGAGPGANGKYKRRVMDVPCKTTGTVVEKDQQVVRCVLKWYVENPVKSMHLFLNKTIYFWSPWTGPEASGTMGRNPWISFSPAIKIAAASPDGYKLVTGWFGKAVSWVWLLSGVFLLLYGFVILYRLKELERLIAVIAIAIISSSWAISLMTLGDHRFRVPIMGLSLFLQGIAIKSLLNWGKPKKLNLQLRDKTAP